MVTEDKADYSTDEGWLAEVRVNSNCFYFAVKKVKPWTGGWGMEFEERRRKNKIAALQNRIAMDQGNVIKLPTAVRTHLRLVVSTLK